MISPKVIGLRPYFGDRLSGLRAVRAVRRRQLPTAIAARWSFGARTLTGAMRFAARFHPANERLVWDGTALVLRRRRRSRRAAGGRIGSTWRWPAERRVESAGLPTIAESSAFPIPEDTHDTRDEAPESAWSDSDVDIGDEPALRPSLAERVTERHTALPAQILAHESPRRITQQAVALPLAGQQPRIAGSVRSAGLAGSAGSARTGRSHLPGIGPAPMAWDTASGVLDAASGVDRVDPTPPVQHLDLAVTPPVAGSFPATLRATIAQAERLVGHYVDGVESPSSGPPHESVAEPRPTAVLGRGGAHLTFRRSLIERSPRLQQPVPRSMRVEPVTATLTATLPASTLQPPALLDNVAARVDRASRVGVGDLATGIGADEPMAPRWIVPGEATNVPGIEPALPPFIAERMARSSGLRRAAISPAQTPLTLPAVTRSLALWRRLATAHPSAVTAADQRLAAQTRSTEAPRPQVNRIAGAVGRTPGIDLDSVNTVTPSWTVPDLPTVATGHATRERGRPLFTRGFAEPSPAAEAARLDVPLLFSRPMIAGRTPAPSARAPIFHAAPASLFPMAPAPLFRRPPIFRSPLADRAEPDAPRQAEAETAMAASTGAPLPPLVRRSMEHLFGMDLASVRVHSGPTAARAVDSVAARAFATGTDVFLPGGVTESDAGQTSDLPLLAHELTHVAHHMGHRPPSAPTLGTLPLARRTSSEEHDAERIERLVTESVQRQPAAAAQPAALTLARAPAPTTILRVEEPAAPATPSSVAADPAAVTAAPAAPGAEESQAKPEEIAERVFELLERRLLVERERGGYRR